LPPSVCRTSARKIAIVVWLSSRRDEALDSQRSSDVLPLL
jgi:hypothetical protein